jgi:hypothetical protein
MVSSIAAQLVEEQVVVKAQLVEHQLGGAAL